MHKYQNVKIKQLIEQFIALSQTTIALHQKCC